ncbi:MAG: DUF4358 domain-containing protein [Eubacteriales bacterium]
MKKSRIMVILSGLGLVVFMAALIWSQYYPDVPMERIAAALAEQPGIAGMRAEDASGLRRYYSIDSAETEGFVFFRSNSIMSADELLVVRAKDHEKALLYLESARKRLGEVTENFENYGAEEMTKIESAICEVRGKYLIFAVSDNASDWERDILGEIKK